MSLKDFSKAEIEGILDLAVRGSGCYCHITVQTNRDLEVWLTMTRGAVDDSFALLCADMHPFKTPFSTGFLEAEAAIT